LLTAGRPKAAKPVVDATDLNWISGNPHCLPESAHSTCRRKHAIWIVTFNLLQADQLAGVRDEISGSA
jgi:hypothetical protein